MPSIASQYFAPLGPSFRRLQTCREPSGWPFTMWSAPSESFENFTLFQRTFAGLPGTRNSAMSLRCAPECFTLTALDKTFIVRAVSVHAPRMSMLCHMLVCHLACSADM